MEVSVLLLNKRKKVKNEYSIFRPFYEIYWLLYW
nr:MAG TPA: hypothetical protein [Caudoviricetes sp.]